MGAMKLGLRIAARGMSRRSMRLRDRLSYIHTQFAIRDNQLPFREATWAS